jgi:hypothetical protein
MHRHVPGEVACRSEASCSPRGRAAEEERGAEPRPLVTRRHVPGEVACRSTASCRPRGSSVGSRAGADRAPLRASSDARQQPFKSSSCRMGSRGMWPPDRAAWGHGSFPTGLTVGPVRAARGSGSPPTGLTVGPVRAAWGSGSLPTGLTVGPVRAARGSGSPPTGLTVGPVRADRLQWAESEGASNPNVRPLWLDSRDWGERGM